MALIGLLGHSMAIGHWALRGKRHSGAYALSRRALGHRGTRSQGHSVAGALGRRGTRRQHHGKTVDKLEFQ